MPNEHFNQLTPAEDERLAKLAEECAEVIQAVCKVQRHGYASTDPTSALSGTNRQDLMHEIADVLEIITRMGAAHDIDIKIVERFTDEQLAGPGKYWHHQ